MRKFVSIGLMMMLAVGAGSEAFAAGQYSGTVAGVARGSDMQPLANVMVQLRNTETGEVVATTVTNEAGTFSFTNLRPGYYIAETVDPSGKVKGVGAPVTVLPGETASTSISAVGSTVTQTTSGGGFRLFGMGPVTSMTVLGAAAAASVAAVVTTRPDASPSR